MIKINLASFVDKSLQDPLSSTQKHLKFSQMIFTEFITKLGIKMIRSGDLLYGKLTSYQVTNRYMIKEQSQRLRAGLTQTKTEYWLHCPRAVSQPTQPNKIRLIVPILNRLFSVISIRCWSKCMKRCCYYDIARLPFSA